MTPAAAQLVTLLMLAAGLTGGAPVSSEVPPRPGVPAASGPLAQTTALGVWPLRPRPTVVAPFELPLTRYGPGHRGVDLAGEAGEEVRAAAAGRVAFAGSIAGRGVVVVSHGARRTTYEPVRAAVKVGAVVGAGDVLGTLQPSGSHCAPAVCLHWGLIEGELYRDPLTLLGRGPVRLLPLHGPLQVRG
jgi:murein DD-endopeptidase MepM/ murein hydrolase activator NlpD